MDKVTFVTPRASTCLHEGLTVAILDFADGGFRSFIFGVHCLLVSLSPSVFQMSSDQSEQSLVLSLFSFVDITVVIHFHWSTKLVAQLKLLPQ